MKLIEQHILYLLENRGIVNVPGIGVFVCRRRSACFDGNSLAAPGVSVYFESFSDGSDDLSDSIAKAESLHIEEAKALVKQEIDDIISSVNSKGGVDFCGIGNLYVTDEGELDFSINSYLGIDCWLPELSLKPIIAQEKELAANTVSTESREEFMRSLRRTASSAAAIAVFVLIAFIVSQLPQRTYDRQQASIGFEQPAPTSLPTTAPQPATDAALVLIFNTPEDASCDVDAVEPEPEIQQPIAEQTATQGRYCLIIASLATRAEADKFMASHSGNLSLLEKDGRYRVVAASSDDYNALEALRSEYASAWICRR